MAVDYDLVVIGGGAAGLVAASAGAQLRAKVALVEKAPQLGGDCLHHGCVPSKTLIRGAAVAQGVRQAVEYGFPVTLGPAPWERVLERVQGAIATIQVHDSIERFESLGVEVIIGDGQFRDRQTFQVGTRVLRSRAFLIATGSRPRIPAIPGLEAAGYQTNVTIFDLQPQPPSLVVIGAGPIGCELGQALARLGTEVTILAGGDRILPREDPELAQVVHEGLVADGVRILHQARPTEVTVLPNGHKRLETPQGAVEVAEIFVAAGRVPNGEGLNLAAAGVEMTERGLVVNGKLQTANPRIYGAGDVVGGYQFTHVASYEAAIVLQNALFLPTKRADYRVIPWATFTAPELARVGLSEGEARQRYGDDVVVLRQGFEGVDRAIATGQTVGCAKLVVRSNGEILGAAIAGPQAGELIHEVVQAMTHGLKVGALHQYIHVYPTLSEVISKAALQFTKQRYQENRRLQGLLAGFFRWRRQWG